jgi:haloalkane dehalogenase
MRIFWGMRDFCFTPKFLDEWQQRFPDAEVRRFENAGHYVLEDAHEFILPVMREFTALCSHRSNAGATRA